MSLSLSFMCTFKHRLSVWLKFSVLALLAFTLLACGGGGDAGGSTIKIDQTALNQTGIVTGNAINRFTTTSIPFTLIGGSGTGAFSVSSSDENIATVTLTDTTGTVNLVGDGIVTITISKAGDDQYKAAEAITIALTIEYNPTNEFSYNSGSTSFGTRKSFAINSTNFDSATEEAPAAYSLKSVSWNTLDDSTVNTTTPSGISVDASTGTITVSDSVNAGEYRLTVEAAFSADNTKVLATPTIIVNKAAIALRFNGGNQLVFQNTVSDINLGDNAIYPLTGNTGNGAVTFALEDNTANIGTVTPTGVFNATADAEGSATIKLTVAETANTNPENFYVPLVVTGKTIQNANVLTFDTISVTKLMTDDTFTRTATKEAAGVGALSYHSSDETVATVSNAGVVTFLSAASTIITAQLAGDTNTAILSKSYRLTINKSPQEPLTYVGAEVANLFSTSSISFTLTGGSGTGAISALSSDDSVATVSINDNNDGGTIILKKEGDFIMTLAKAGDNDYIPTSRAVQMQITNVAPVLPVPSALVARQGDEDINLSWTSTANKFRIHQATETFASVDDPANYSVLAGYTSQEVTDATQATITGLTNGTVYYFVVTSVSADGSRQSSISDEVSMTSEKLVPGTGKLNDTGMTWGGGYSSGNNTGCNSFFTDIDNLASVSINAPQDCDQGRDALAAAGDLTKIGAGAAGFDFTKISSTGATLAADATAWSCVLDNHTGLMWEFKTDDGWHDKNNTYTWYNTDATTNGGSAGTATHASTPNTCEGYTVGSEGTYCNTQAFVARVNTQGLCGATNWRLPYIEELHSIVDHSRTSPSIDMGYFPNTSSNYFWSSSPNANSTHVRQIDFSNGNSYNSYASDKFSVRLVRTVP